jgi:diphosphate-dependent phosphofructokinase
LNGDLKNQFVETTVGFDTVCKVTKKLLLEFGNTMLHINLPLISFCMETTFQVNSQLVSNVCLDAISAGKVTTLAPHLIIFVSKVRS